MKLGAYVRVQRTGKVPNYRTWYRAVVGREIIEMSLGSLRTSCSRRANRRKHAAAAKNTGMPLLPPNFVRQPRRVKPRAAIAKMSRISIKQVGEHVKVQRRLDKPVAAF